MVFALVQRFVNLGDAFVLAVFEEVFAQKINGSDTDGGQENNGGMACFRRKSAADKVLYMFCQMLDGESEQGTQQSHQKRNKDKFKIILGNNFGPVHSY